MSNIERLQKEIGPLKGAQFSVYLFFSLSVFFLFAGIPGITGLNPDSILLHFVGEFRVFILTSLCWAAASMVMFLAIDIQTKINTLKLAVNFA